MGKPSYLPLLNSIAVNERKGEIFLSAWADTTEDADLEAALRFVAIREGEHAWAFTKRMCELGYGVSEEDAFQVDVYHRIPVSLAHPDQKAVSGNARIVD